MRSQRPRRGASPRERPSTRGRRLAEQAGQSFDPSVRCGKAVFRTKDEAFAARAVEKRRANMDLRPYHCVACGFWHLTRQGDEDA